MASPPVIVWFRRDLRVSDNPALCEAVNRGGPVLPVFVLEDDAPRPLGGTSRWWLHQSLRSLCRELRRLGTSLVLRRGSAVAELLCLAEQSGARTVLWNRRYDPREATIDEAVTSALVTRGIQVEHFNASLLFEPQAVRTRQGQPFQMFTPFWRSCLSLPEPSRPLPRPAHLHAHEGVTGDCLDDWRLAGGACDWSCGISTVWTPGEDAADARLADFLDDGLPRYGARHDRPDQDGTSRLSPHMAFGELSPRQVWHAAREAGAHRSDGFLRELCWREFCHHTLHSFPQLPDQPLRPEFQAFPWVVDETHWAAFTAGYTGYPIVDAGMRALWETGWLHNRVRMIVASFLVKDLLIPWQRGAGWFWNTLLDADVASNACGWQWVAGCGVEASPYFRIFNPVVQGEKFDPRGNYVRRWVPELANLADTYIHHPWEAPESVLAGAGVTLGRTYPRPIVEHDSARRRALLAYGQVKGAA